MTNPPTRATKRQALLNLADAHAEEVLAASKSDIIEDASAAGLDMMANARRMRDMLAQVETKVGKAAIATAREALHSRTGTAVARRPGTTGRGAAMSDATALTLAARNESEQSDRDKATVQDDIDELDALLAERERNP